MGPLNWEGQFGEIVLNSSPARAAVYFDGEKISARTPVTIRRVPRDKSHTVKIEMDGYRTWQTTVNLDDTDTKRYDVSLEEK
jgi:hypothetical protein